MPNCGRHSKLKRNRLKRAAAAANAATDAICASCGIPCYSAAGAWQKKRHATGGPLHCAACWGDYDATLPETLPAAKPNWWHAPAVEQWLQAAPALDESKHFVAGHEFVCLSVRANDPETTHFPGVGSVRPWPSSKRLTRYLAEHHVRLLPQCATVVEVGSGACSLPGLWLAHRLRAPSRLVLTDLPALQPLIERNVLANLERVHAAGGIRPEVAALRWGCAADLHNGCVPTGADLVLAADVLYFPEDVTNLFATIAQLAAPTVLLALMPRDGQAHQYDTLVEEAVAARGWGCFRAPALTDDGLLAACVLFELRLGEGGGPLSLPRCNVAGFKLPTGSWLRRVAPLALAAATMMCALAFRATTRRG